MMSRRPGKLRANVFLCVGLIWFGVSTAFANNAAALRFVGPSELELGLSDATAWTVNQFENLVEIKFSSLEVPIDLPASAEISETAQVSDIETTTGEGETSILLTLSCECQVAVLRGQDQSVRILVLPDNRAAVAELPAIEVAGPAPMYAPAPVSKPLGVAMGAAEEGTVDVERARERLLEQLQRAAEAGLVQLENPPPAVEQPAIVAGGNLPEEPQSDSSSNNGVLTETQPPPMVTAEVPAGPAQVVAAAHSETGPPAKIGAEHASVDEVQEKLCFPEKQFALPDIENSDEFLTLVSESRSRQLGEFDQPNPEAIEQLSRVYISAMLLDEALLTLQEVKSNDPPLAVLRELSLLLQGKELPATAHLSNSECIGDHALWRAFHEASLDRDEDAVKSESMAGRALERLPGNLREIVSAALGHAAANIGDWESARRFEAMAVRSAPATMLRDGNSLLLSARLADWRGEVDQAWKLRWSARQSNPPFDSIALIQLAEEVLKSDRALTSDTSDLRLDLGTLALIERGTDLGARAFELEARLSVSAEGRDQLVSMISEGTRSGLLPSDRQASLMTALLDDPLEEEASRPLGLIYLEEPEKFAPALKQEAFRHAVVRSLLELALPSLAMPLLNDKDKMDHGVAAPVARALLSEDDPRTAMELVQHLPDGPSKAALVLAVQAVSGSSVEPTSDVLQAGTSADQIIALETVLDRALVDGDAGKAIDASRELLTLDPGVDRAEQYALLTLMSGSSNLPPEAQKILEAEDPAKVERLKTFFRPLPPRRADLNVDDASQAVEQLNQEMELLEALISDG